MSKMVASALHFGRHLTEKHALLVVMQLIDYVQYLHTTINYKLIECEEQLDIYRSKFTNVCAQCGITT